VWASGNNTARARKRRYVEPRLSIGPTPSVVLSSVGWHASVSLRTAAAVALAGISQWCVVLAQRGICLVLLHNVGCRSKLVERACCKMHDSGRYRLKGWQAPTRCSSSGTGGESTAPFAFFRQTRETLPSRARLSGLHFAYTVPGSSLGSLGARRGPLCGGPMRRCSNEIY